MLPADLSDPKAVESLAQAALDSFDGRVDVLVHNAGIYHSTPLLETPSLADWRDAMRSHMQVNFWAGAELAYLLTPAMADAGWGRIIQISSRAGNRGEAHHAGYGASKSAQINFVNPWRWNWDQSASAASASRRAGQKRTWRSGAGRAR